MGIYLQRSWIVDLITLIILLPVFIFGRLLFTLLGQEESIAERAGFVSLWFIPFLYSFVFSLTIQMYLQAQLKNKLIAWISVLQFILHVPLSWLFVTYFSFGLPGAMTALIISSWFLGVWIGMISGIVCQSIALCVLAWRTNWDVQVLKASERLNRFYLKSEEETSQSSNHA
ncbi:hypothetical protein POM88_041462 [Heracleum sosnowskyi]|uniref:Uncharacterized protein n=1 Tax=Heracleum sosnowskyi TaxID=360622 RepID=A0AAD8HF17_9APIA|nr:hypothetical protein POM88_041462 [Heracleum sosnowskyi]